MNNTTANMSAWSSADLARIRPADDLHISPFRTDGKTYGTPTWIWSVVVDQELYVRAYYGQRSRWYGAAITQQAGRIHIADMVKDVAFSPVADPELNARIDAAYQTKYADSPYLAAMVSERARAATIQIRPLTNP